MYASLRANKDKAKKAWVQGKVINSLTHSKQFLPYQHVMVRPRATDVSSIILDDDSGIHRVLPGLHSDILELCSSHMARSHYHANRA